MKSLNAMFKFGFSNNKNDEGIFVMFSIKVVQIPSVRNYFEVIFIILHPRLIFKKNSYFC